MGKNKFDKKQTKAVMRLLDSAANKYSLPLVKSVAMKWCNAQRDRTRLAKQRAALEKQLAEVSARLRG